VSQSASWGFRHCSLEAGIVEEVSHQGVAGRLRSVADTTLPLEAGATHLGFCVEGADGVLETNTGRFPVPKGMYFALPGTGQFTAKRGVVITRDALTGYFMLGGPFEERGRLRYIDGCTDSLLIPPALLGDPCLNLLHIPAHTAQSAHTHSSFRTGLVLSGHGDCVLGDGQRMALVPGTLFVIEAEQLHSFHTTSEDLRVIAYHPDSDTGPTHENHPMINRTLLPRAVSS